MVALAIAGLMESGLFGIVLGGAICAALFQSHNKVELLIAQHRISDEKAQDKLRLEAWFRYVLPVALVCLTLCWIAGSRG